MPDQPRDALSIPCPKCGESAGAPCRQPTGKVLTGPHKSRIDALAEGIAPDAVPSVLITDEGMRLYRAIAEKLRDRGDWCAWTATLTERVCRNSEEAKTCREVASAQPTVPGSNDNIVAHPLWSVQFRLEDRVLADLKSLKMTPDSVGWGKQDGGSGVPKDDLDALDDVAAAQRDEVAAQRARRSA